MLYKKTIKEIRSEFRKSTNTAIVTAFGILVALSWKDLISELVSEITILNSVQSQLASTLIITLIAVLGIYLTTKILREKEKDDK